MIGIIVCNKIIMYSSINLQVVYNLPFDRQRDADEPQSRDYHYLLFAVHWMLRATWMAQELLHSFSTDIASVTLIPGTGGIFVVAVDDVQIWERKQDGGFPDAAELKRRVRDVCFPEKALGHVDKPA